ncbi:hypothetical protein ACT6NV_12260 [Robiginitalea sp. IMCC44478]|uniref:hypothetical protein n=1 Tax=Robiginitalea sp. IMCC44478 TaxID=3459122 RepID=UPI0040416B3B
MNNKIDKILSVILGIALLIFGLDKFFAFVPHGHVMTEELMAAYQGLLANKFIMPTVGVVEILSGILLLSGRYVIIALTAMIPIVYGILAFHLAVDVPGIVPGLIIAFIHVYLIINRRKAIKHFVVEANAV